MLMRENPTPPKRVVVVEDDPAIAVLIAAVLDDEGYEPYVVRDGRKALQAVHELRPDAITLDLELPGLDGRTVLRRLGDETPGRRPPVVVVSASTDRLSRDERRLVAHTLTKPFDLGELVQAVDDVVEREAV